ncbi:hypothetical protein FOL47_005534, partial [Perkinsus chesapeaki]
ATFDAGSIGSLLAMRASIDMLPLSNGLERRLGHFSTSHFYVTNEFGQVLASTDAPAVYVIPAPIDDRAGLSFPSIWEVTSTVKKEHFIEALSKQGRVTMELGTIRVDLEVAKSSGAPLVCIAVTSASDFRDARLTLIALLQ